MAPDNFCLAYSTQKMVFVSNPLSLSVPDPVFESWLRDTGYLEILDEVTTTDPSPPPPDLLHGSTTAAAPAGVEVRWFTGACSFLRLLLSVFTLNPFAKLTSEDLARSTPLWTLEFIGAAGSYSLPAGPSQLRMRAQENVRRYARNYAALLAVFLACSLYQMPVSLLGLISSLCIWEVMRYWGDKWEQERRFLVMSRVIVRVAQIGTAVILYLCNIQLALICAIIVSYTVMILHASLRKLTPLKQNEQLRRTNGRKPQFAAKQ